MIHKPGSQPEATALWFDPKNVTLNKDVNTAREEEIGGGRKGGILRPSTYGVCRSRNTSMNQYRQKDDGKKQLQP